MKVPKVAAVAAALTFVMGACSTELILEREGGDEPVPVQTTEAPVEPDNGDLSRGDNDPEPVAISYGDCLDVDFSGQSVRFAAVVECGGVHDAQVFDTAVIDEDPVPVVREWCHEQLPSSLQEEGRGRAYALESPVGYVHNQGVASRGEEVLCVFVHAEPRDGGFAEPRADDDDEG